MRNDKEKSLRDQEFEAINSILNKRSEAVYYIDTVIEDKLITLENKESFLNQLLNNFSKKKLIITDRLQEQIFSYITGTPAIVFSNSNGKVEKCYNWIKGCGYVIFMNHFDTHLFLENINRAMLVKPNKQKFEEQKLLFTTDILSAL